MFTDRDIALAIAQDIDRGGGSRPTYRDMRGWHRLRKARWIWRKPRAEIRNDASYGPGAANPNSKLTAEKVREARRRSALGETFVQLGKVYGVSPQSMENAVKGKTWKHVN